MPRWLYGLTEIAQALGVSPGLVAIWRFRGRLPKPDAELAMGPVWTANTIRPWLEAKMAALIPRAELSD